MWLLINTTGNSAHGGGCAGRGGGGCRITAAGGGGRGDCAFGGGGPGGGCSGGGGGPGGGGGGPVVTMVCGTRAACNRIEQLPAAGCLKHRNARNSLERADLNDHRSDIFCAVKHTSAAMLMLPDPAAPV